MIILGFYETKIHQEAREGIQEAYKAILQRVLDAQQVA